MPSYYRNSVDIIVHTSNTCLKEYNRKVYSLLHHHLAESLRAHSVLNSIRRMTTGVDSISSGRLGHKTRPLIPPIIALVIVLGLVTCQLIISMICTSHWLPPYALHLLCGKRYARVREQGLLFGCSFSMQIH
jgi:hypothetical protein